ncbi:hypothetical protein FNV43_RR20820 [Rhamnella rubrinervis]|uniref:RRM domain-containing protein n=1 Tax=Rhamnella rubrinervis TaxID=2594499 RepID=A0A8K0E1W6_9ROSA|nr:hypothetical protein FNV43_RR20820 [Rhamnella rubrinervis]
MALFSKLGNILRQTSNKQISNELRSSSPSIFQAIRCMSSSKLFIGGISYQTDEQSLREAFAKYGEVVDARIIVDRDTGRSRGFGFITYTSSEEASSAIQALDGQDLHGRRVRVNYATDRRSSFGGGGGDGYGGGGYGGGGYGGGGYGGGGYGGGGGGYGGGGGGYGRETYSGGGGGYNTAGNYGGGGDGFSSGGNFSSNYGGSGNTSGSYEGGNGVGYSSGNFANTSESGGFGSSGNFGTGGFDGNVGPGFGGGDQIASNESAGIGGGIEDNNQDDSLDGNYRDDDDSDYAKRA